MIFRVFAILCDHCFCLVPKHFYQLWKKIPYPLSNSSQFSLPIDPGNPSTSFHMFLRFIHVIVCISTLFLFLWLINIPFIKSELIFWLSGHEFEWTPGVGDGQGSLACCNPWDHKKSDTTEWLKWIFHCMAIWDFFSPIYWWAYGLFPPSGYCK